jgi:hypothetical protein
MADKDHSLDFWSSVAESFKSNNEIIFDLYNEPHDISWSCWENGTGCQTLFPVASMQEMINGIRATGATNVLMLGGLSYANDLSGWLNNEPNDPLSNLVASFHMYGKNQCATEECWNSIVLPVLNQVPVIAGEFGESADATVCGVTLSNTFMQWMDQHNSGYLAWVWDTWGSNCGNLSLITNYDGTPLSPNGTNFRDHILGLVGRIQAVLKQSLSSIKDIPNQPLQSSSSNLPVHSQTQSVSQILNPSPTIYCLNACISPTIFASEPTNSRATVK